MTILKIAGVLVVLLVIASADAFACSCETYGVPRKDAKEYYTKKFKGAIFTGTVESMEHDPAYDQGRITFSKLKVTITEYWLGVKTPTIVVMVPGPNTSCWQDWKLGEEWFFVVTEDGHFALCDLLNWKPSDSEATLGQYTTTLLGKPKSFPKPK